MNSGQTSIHDRALGRWEYILSAVGIDRKYLTKRHTACPICNAGKDRFRWTDHQGKGSYICNQCGSGTGIDLVMAVLKTDFRGAVKAIEPHVGSAPIVAPKAQQAPKRDGAAMWGRGQKLIAGDVVTRYLAKRGIRLDTLPSQLRLLPDASYRHDDGRRETHPAMLAHFVAPDLSSATVHFTYLTEAGEKAPVPTVRKYSPGPVPKGGAVRLAPSAETMGVAEGIETALAAAALNDIPVWSTLTAGGLLNWEPPATARNIIIFGDCDGNFTGQCAAYSLAHKLANLGLRAEVRIPDELGTDWNDVLQGSMH